MEVALVGLATALIGAALFGQVPRGGGDPPSEQVAEPSTRDGAKSYLPVGDRIAAGMLAATLLAVVLPGAIQVGIVALAAPLPLLGYLTALAINDHSRFSWIVYVLGLAAYVFVGLAVLL